VKLAEQEKTETTQEGKALRFFEEEYQLNHLIATLDKPYVALLNGITSTVYSLPPNFDFSWLTILT